MKRILRASAAALAALAIISSPASAGTPLAPEISDVFGDANFVNGHGFDNLEPVSTPVALDSADLKAIWFETTYRPEKDRLEDGTVTRVRYEPGALLVNIKTVAPPRPATGPGLYFNVPVTIAGCEIWFEGYVAGTGFVGDEASIWKNGSNCPGGTGYITNPKFIARGSGDTLILEYGLDALPYSNSQIILAEDVEIRPVSTVPMVSLSGTHETSIDEATPLMSVYQIGEGIPDDIVCAEQPDHAECQSA